MLALTVHDDNIQENTPLIIHTSGGNAQRNNQWRLLPDGRIVLHSDQEYAVTVKDWNLRNGQEIILHTSDNNAQGNNQWEHLPDGRIVLREGAVDGQRLSLTVKDWKLQEHQAIILHTSDGNPQDNNRWKLQEDGRLTCPAPKIKAVVSLPGGPNYEANRLALRSVGFLTPVVFFPNATRETDPDHSCEITCTASDEMHLCWQCQWLSNLKVLKNKYGDGITFLAIPGGGPGCAWERRCLRSKYPNQQEEVPTP